MNPFKAIAIRLRDQGFAGLLPTTKNRAPLGGSPSQRPSVRQPRQESTMRNEFGVEVPVPEEYGVQPSEPWPRDDGPHDSTIPPGYEDPSVSRTATATPGIPYPGESMLERELFRQATIERYMGRGLPPEEAGERAAIRLQERFGTLSEHQRMRDAYSGIRPLTQAERDELFNAGTGVHIPNVTSNTSITREYPPLYHNDMPMRPIQGDSMAITNLPYPNSHATTGLSCNGCTHSITKNIYCEACDRGLIHSDRPLGAIPIIDRFISKDNQDYLYNEWKEKVTVKLKKEAMQEVLDEMKNEKKIIKKKTLTAIVKRTANPDMRHKC